MINYNKALKPDYLKHVEIIMNENPGNEICLNQYAKLCLYNNTLNNS